MAAPWASARSDWSHSGRNAPRDTANILAELAGPDLLKLADHGTLEGSPFAVAVRDYASRPVDAKIWGLTKQSLDYRVYVTDVKGRVVFDSG